MIRSFVFACLLAATPGVPLFAESRTVPGVTEAFMDVTLSSTVQGIIHTRYFDEGATVKEGQTILELDSALEELETQRRAAVTEHSRADFESTRSLFSRSKAVSKDELQKKEMEYKVAVAELGIATENLKRRKVIAPFSGTIVDLFLKPGASCEPYQPLIRLVDTTRCYFIGHVQGNAGIKIAAGTKVKVSVQGAAEPFDAVISFVAPVVDSASGLVKVKALFENADGRVRPGLAAEMILE
ncbi:MAG: efflux RND transporter periplasmic adaptor subunit [Chthoniobacteraceae bacterium]